MLDWTTELPEALPDDIALHPENPAHFKPWMAVLASQKIPFTVEWRNGRNCLVVAWEDAEAAEEAISSYEQYNVNWPPPDWKPDSRKNPPLVTRPSTAAAALTVIVLAAIYVRSYLEGNLWHDVGVWDAAAIARGEWWRVITALTLHGDESHLASNLGWCGGLLAVLGAYVGSGTALSFMLLAGACGNAVMFWTGATHNSIGASGMVFGLVGLLCTAHTILRWKEHPDWRGWGLVRLLPWAPLFAGVVLFAMYGISPGTDVLCHATGFLCGLLLGCPAALLARFRKKSILQLCLALLPPLMVYIAWHAALAT